MPRAGTSRELWKSSAYLAVAVVLALGALQLFRSGQFIPSLVLCLLSLGVCSYVVLLSYPHFLRWVRSRGFQIPWDYRLTREGLFYVAVVVVVATAAALSGNNLLYLVLSCLLAAMLLAGFLSRLVLSGLQLDVELPDHIFAEQPVLLRISLRNLKRWMPSFSIWMSAGAPTVLRAPRPQKAKSHSPETVSPKKTSALDMAPAYCPMVTGGSTAAASMRATFLRRGRFRNEVFWLRTRFPFSFVERRARLQPAREITVYPSVKLSPAVEEIVQQILSDHSERGGGVSHDLYRVRPALPEDEARFVDWKATARSRTLMVKEFTKDDYLRAEIVFDRYTSDSERGRIDFERAVQQCAALVWRLHTLKADLRFVSSDLVIASAPGTNSVYEILRYLSTLQPLYSTTAGATPVPWDSRAMTAPTQIVFGASSSPASPALQSSKVS